MNGIKTQKDTEVTVSDLKNLGRQGDVTARLDSGEIIELKAKYAIRKRLAIVAGQETEAEIIVFYPEIYKQIRTVKEIFLSLEKLSTRERQSYSSLVKAITDLITTKRGC